jgi:uncharacterized membrane protein
MTQTGSRHRLDAIDLLRGVVIVLMALDHVKGNFTSAQFDPTDLAKTTPAYFVTRWVTHFCAPVFVFLAGTGAFLAGSHGKGRGALSWFLFSRGLWLILLELTVIRFAWFLEVSYTFSFGQVIWAIGWSMIALSALVFLPVSAITVFGVAVIAFHNLSDNVSPEKWGDFAWLWQLLHTGGEVKLDTVFHAGDIWEWTRGKTFWAMYPVLPWLGVMAAGYGFGALWLLPPQRRRKELLGLGLALTVTFIALRYANIYGDKPWGSPTQAGPWSVQEHWWLTLFSFVNCQKYPPSLCFLLMTLGPAITALALFDHTVGPVGRFFVTFGRVPLFFYLLHWYLIKGLVFAFAFARYRRADWLYGGPPRQPPSGDGYDLWVIYLVWIVVVALMWPLCAWFAGIKRRSRSAWLSYL